MIAERPGFDKNRGGCYTGRAMKASIHPEYHPKAKVTCACGNHFTVGSTRESLHVSICSACHPFYTGTEKIVDVRGRVDRFKKRLERSSKKPAKKA